MTRTEFGRESRLAAAGTEKAHHLAAGEPIGAIVMAVDVHEALSKRGIVYENNG